jgi:hypothetical protein
MLSELRYLWSIIWRGFGQALTLWAVTQFCSVDPSWAKLNHLIETNRMFFALIVQGFNALYELWVILRRPEPRPPCNNVSPMLNLGEDK